MPKILVTGANGQLGNEVRKISNRCKEFEFVYTDVDTLDITNLVSLQTFFKGHNFNYIINCAAYTAVDKAESDVEMATRINCDAVRNLTTVAKENNCVFVHVSTDYVFDGTACVPYTEDVMPNPQGVYGKTKLAGENEALKYDKSIVIRTSWLYSTFGNNFVKTMLRLGSERTELGIVFDQAGTPTYAEDLADAILSIISFTETNGVKSGMYHFSNEGVCSWYDFTWEIVNFAKLSCNVKPINSADYPTPTKRPSFSVLNKSKIKRTFNITISYWKTSAYKCLNELLIAK